MQCIQWYSTVSSILYMPYIFDIPYVPVTQRILYIQLLHISMHTPPSTQRGLHDGGGVKKRDKVRTAEERSVDSWTVNGASATWRRAHRTPRRAVFIPHRVSGGPGAGIKMCGRRVTKGTYVGSGETFEITDDYRDPNSAHRVT